MRGVEERQGGTPHRNEGREAGAFRLCTRTDRRVDAGVVAGGQRRQTLASTILAGFVGASAYFGAVGVISGLLPVKAALAERLPLHSPVFGGVALAAVVAAPPALGAVLARRRP